MGHPTRGKTASNRLRRVDNFILLYEPSILSRTDGCFTDSMFVDLGYGFDARTTLESASRFRRVVAGEPIYDFFEAWKQSARETAALKAYGARQWFTAAAESLRRKGYRVNVAGRFLSKGYLVWGI